MSQCSTAANKSFCHHDVSYDRIDNITDTSSCRLSSTFRKQQASIAYFVCLSSNSLIFVIRARSRVSVRERKSFRVNKRMTTSTAALTAAAAVSQTALHEIARHVVQHAPSSIASPIAFRGGATRAKKNAPSSEMTPPNTLLQSFFLIPAPLRYFISGNCGNVVFYFMERFLYLALYHLHFSRQPLPDEWTEIMLPSWVNSATFFSAYILHVPAQHYLHALLVYGLESINTPSKYYKTLGGMFSTLTGSALGSTALNAFLLSTGKFNKTAAFIATLWSFSIINYLIIGWIVRASNKSSTEETVHSRKVPRGGAILMDSSSVSRFESTQSSLKNKIF